MPFSPGIKVGPYEILAPLGEGGMGAVYQAHDPTLQRTVAIKVLAKQDGDASARVLQEARAASALNHPHICTIYEVGEHEGQAFIHPDGRTVYYKAIEADGGYSFWAVPATGGEPRRIVEFDDPFRQTRAGIAWDTDGERLYFTIVEHESDIAIAELVVPN